MGETTEPPGPGHAWCQVSLWCRDWQAAEHTAVTHLGPALAEMDDAGLLTGWWFMRKDACWRLRYLPLAGRQEHARARIDEIMRKLAVTGPIERWAPTFYEPETHAFGGPHAMNIAHTLFHADSRHLLDHLRRAGDGHRSELGVLLACGLMRGASQDYYEQGDIWATVAAHRPAGRPPTAREIHGVHRLITARPADSACVPQWPAAFHDAGATLAGAAHHGQLARGLRAVLAHHLLFAFNRAGISARRQGLLAEAATEAVFHHDPPPGPARRHAQTRDGATRVAGVNSTRSTHTADRLRSALVDYIRRRGTFRTPAVEEAFTRVPRHVFLPDVDLEAAYAPQVVVTKRADDGSAISSASHPNMVASMLEQLDVRPGHRVLEIGAATGINAALLAELVGPTGNVVTIEIDDDLAQGARTALTTAGYDHVTVVRADGAFGHPDAAPYDRIIVTAGAFDIPAAWWQQLAPAGRIVVPLRLHASGLTRSIAFDRETPSRMVSDSTKVCGFVPLRGASDSPGHAVRLADDIALSLAPDDADTTDALAQALTHPAHEVWTGITINDRAPVEHLDLWLATIASHFARLAVGAEARDSGHVTPALRWGGATLHDGAAGTLAYLTLRPTGDQTKELGLIAHGPDAPAFAARTAELLHRWHKEHPTQPTITAHPAGTPERELPSGTRIRKPDTTLTLTW